MTAKPIEQVKQVAARQTSRRAAKVEPDANDPEDAGPATPEGDLAPLGVLIVNALIFPVVCAVALISGVGLMAALVVALFGAAGLTLALVAALMGIRAARHEHGRHRARGQACGVPWADAPAAGRVPGQRTDG